ncbi:SRPBCC family protein [Mycolicibacterium frederiksbergense]|uniref:SRPBCC family protein n=1 Tax=Mycolicibacterium frederiksbergense TaxID=117567 RepID=UPI00265B85CE|nr:SRPBCC family protein [Mycolicibacterium frederiksbergense]MDO0976420.1 SRPBCC family protein [Mycolicibacterium frederiksbergense]
MSAQRTINEVIPAAPDVVRDFYVDLDNLRTLHPLIVAVQRTARTVGPDGFVSDYRVQDRIPFGRTTLPVTYTATLHVPVEGEVWTEARQFPRVRLRGRVSFDEVDAGTRLTERLSITAPWPLAGFTARQAVAAHAAMLAGIRQHFA